MFIGNFLTVKRARCCCMGVPLQSSILNSISVTHPQAIATFQATVFVSLVFILIKTLNSKNAGLSLFSKFDQAAQLDVKDLIGSEWNGEIPRTGGGRWQGLGWILGRIFLWRGKIFYSAEDARALILGLGRLSVDIPLGASVLQNAPAFTQPGSNLSTPTVQMTYKHVPQVVDYFRKLDETTLIGISTVGGQIVAHFLLYKVLDGQNTT